MPITCHSRLLRAAAVSTVTGSVLLGSAISAVADAPAKSHPPRAAAALAEAKTIKISIGEADFVSVKNGTPNYHGKVLKPGQTLKKNGIYIHYSTDSKRIYTKAGGTGARYAIWSAKTGASLGSQKSSPTAKKLKATVSAKASASTVRVWHNLSITGKSTGLKQGSKLTLQQKQHGGWKSLPASTATNKSGAYSLHAKLGLKGKNSLRMVSSNVTSPVFLVTVR